MFINLKFSDTIFDLFSDKRNTQNVSDTSKIPSCSFNSLNLQNSKSIIDDVTIVTEPDLHYESELSFIIPEIKDNEITNSGLPENELLGECSKSYNRASMIKTGKIFYLQSFSYQVI